MNFRWFLTLLILLADKRLELLFIVYLLRVLILIAPVIIINIINNDLARQLQMLLKRPHFELDIGITPTESHLFLNNNKQAVHELVQSALLLKHLEVFLELKNILSFLIHFFQIFKI